MTVRRLILMRHAKSSWADHGQADHERPLNKRGRRDAPRVAQELADLGWEPDFIVSSDARRTQETWERMAPILGSSLPVHWSNDLYLAGLGDLQADSGHWPNEAHTILALGHNPGWEQALGQLAGAWSGMTTANAGLLEGAGSTWSEALEQSWELARLIRPRELD